jgi:LPXTG-motif cell wall-anchored protein
MAAPELANGQPPAGGAVSGTAPETATEAAASPAALAPVPAASPAASAMPDRLYALGSSPAATDASGAERESEAPQFSTGAVAIGVDKEADLRAAQSGAPSLQVTSDLPTTGSAGMPWLPIAAAASLVAGLALIVLRLAARRLA